MFNTIVNDDITLQSRNQSVTVVDNLIVTLHIDIHYV